MRTGVPLIEFLRERGGSARDDLVLFRGLCEAVHYAHSHAIIHRDLKPSNVLVTAAGEVTLLDFGIAKQAAEAGGDPARTVSGLRMMTPGYAAPEQLAGEGVGVFTDVYALGVLLYELLTGATPGDKVALGLQPVQRPSAVARVAGAGGALPCASASGRTWTCCA